jgi:hypothetical protein
MAKMFFIRINLETMVENVFPVMEKHADSGSHIVEFEGDTREEAYTKVFAALAALADSAQEDSHGKPIRFNPVQPGTGDQPRLV